MTARGLLGTIRSLRCTGNKSAPTANNHIEPISSKRRDALQHITHELVVHCGPRRDLNPISRVPLYYKRLEVLYCTLNSCKQPKQIGERTNASHSKSIRCLYVVEASV